MTTLIGDTVQPTPRRYARRARTAENRKIVGDPMVSCSSPSQLLRTVAFLGVALVASGVSGHASAQCSQWLAGSGVASGVPGTAPWTWWVTATTMWDPDGAGPMQPILAVGGQFSFAGTVSANRIAAYDPVTGAWSALGTGMDNDVRTRW